MAFYDYIKVRGLTSDYPSAEMVEGIGGMENSGAGSADSPINVEVVIPDMDDTNIVEAIEALQYNAEELELPGNIRLHLTGKVLTY